MGWLKRNSVKFIEVFYSKIGKRILDLGLGVIMFLFFLPVFLFLAIVISLFFFGSPFFLQDRPGKDGRIFKIIKFKTMSELFDAKGKLLADSERLSQFGKIIRKTSLDELPQLLNVIKGDMSLVGPRPLLVDYLPLYSPIQSRRHLVKPGVTGWAQINGRNTISWQEKFQLDVWYVEHISLLLDLKILLKTLANVLMGKGVSQQGHVTIGRFKGN